MILPLLLGAAILVTPSRAERVVIFKAAGFTPTTGDYLMCDKETPWDPLESTCRHASLSIL